MGHDGRSSASITTLVMQAPNYVLLWTPRLEAQRSARAANKVARASHGRRHMGAAEHER